MEEIFKMKGENVGGNINYILLSDLNERCKGIFDYQILDFSEDRLSEFA